MSLEPQLEIAFWERAARREAGLVAMDLDGTLLQPDGTASAHSRQTLQALNVLPWTPVLVTARPPRLARDMAVEMGVGGTAICCNGGVTYDVDGDRVIDHQPLDCDLLHGLVEDLRRRLDGITLAWECGLTYGCEPGFGAADRFRGGIFTTDLTSMQEPFTKLIVYHPRRSQEALLDEVRHLAGARAFVTTSGPEFIELSAVGVDKAAALRRLAAKLGVERDAVIAFGDMPNDAAMLEWAGWGVAVANAHPAVIAIADEVTAPNSEDGVALVLSRLTDAWQKMQPATTVGDTQPERR